MKVFSIRTKMAGITSAMVAIVVAFMALAGYQFITVEFKNAVAAHHFAMLEMAANNLDDQIRHAQTVLDTIVTSIPPGSFSDRTRMQHYLDSEQDARGIFDGGFVLIDANGKIICESPSHQARSGKYNYERDYVRKTLTSGQPTISAPYISAVPPFEPTVTFTAPVKDGAGKLIGLLAGRHLLLRDNFLADLSKVAIGKTGYLYLIDSDRTIIMHQNRNRVMEKIQPGKNIGIDRALEGFEGTVENLNSAGVRGITSFNHLHTVSWTIASHYPLEEAYAPLNRIRSLLVFGVLLVLAVSLAAVLIISRRITSPLVKLAGHVRSLPDLSGTARKVSDVTRDEIGELACAFNDMLDQLDFKQDEIRKGQEVFRIMAEFTSELAILRNLDGTLRYISPNCLAVTGYTVEEFLESGGLLERIIHPDDLERWQNHIDLSGDNLCCTAFDLRMVTKGGELLWFTHACHEVTNDQGEIVGTRGSFRDISKRKELEGLLDQQVRFAERLLDSTTTPLFVIDGNHRVIVWNRGMVDLTGMRADQVLGTSEQWRPFYPHERPTLADFVLQGNKENLPEHYSTYESISDNPGALRAEGWYRNINGRDRYLFFDAAPVRDDEGRVVAAVETLKDITERKKSEESLRLFSQAVEQSASTIVITDTEGTIQYVNNKFCDVTGYSREEAIGSNPRVLKSGYQSPEVYEGLWGTIKSGRQWHGEFNNKRKDGSHFWELVTISPVISSEGNITHFLAIKDDITERKEIEQKLLKQQAEQIMQHEQLKSLFHQVESAKKDWEQTMDCIGDMVIMTDGEGLVRRCNREATRFFARDFHKTVGCHWDQLFSSLGMAAGKKLQEGEEFYQQESDRWFLLNKYSLGSSPEGVQLGEVITIHDMTEQKGTNAELEKAYTELHESSGRLESAFAELKSTHMQLLQQEKMASIGQLAAGVAHEINNPMGFISSNLGTLGKYTERLKGFIETQADLLNSAGVGDASALAEARKKFKVDYVLADIPKLIAESTDGAERVRSIVQNLKSFSRVDESESKQVDLNDCLESTISIAWNELKYKTTLQKELGELPPVTCHPQQLNQVFLNLLVNAAHAIEKQGEVTVRTWQDGDHVCIAISDTGSGIPEEIRAKIFEPFFTTKEVGKGTGLGLSISYEIIQRHNGTISVTSEVGVGTTFTVRLPIGGGDSK